MLLRYSRSFRQWPSCDTMISTRGLTARSKVSHRIPYLSAMVVTPRSNTSREASSPRCRRTCMKRRWVSGSTNWPLSLMQPPMSAMHCPTAPTMPRWSRHDSFEYEIFHGWSFSLCPVVMVRRKFGSTAIVEILGFCLPQPRHDSFPSGMVPPAGGTGRALRRLLRLARRRSRPRGTEFRRHGTGRALAASATALDPLLMHCQ